MQTIVIGHRNPDTDAICSAIGYAEYKQRTNLPEAIAARCGDTNDRIDFVLKTFGLPAPKFVSDVTPKIRDVIDLERHCVDRRGEQTIGRRSVILAGVQQYQIRVGAKN